MRLADQLLHAHREYPMMMIFLAASRICSALAGIADVHALALKLKIDELKKETNP